MGRFFVEPHTGEIREAPLLLPGGPKPSEGGPQPLRRAALAVPAIQMLSQPGRILLRNPDIAAATNTQIFPLRHPLSRSNLTLHRGTAFTVRAPARTTVSFENKRVRFR